MSGVEKTGGELSSVSSVEKKMGGEMSRVGTDGMGIVLGGNKDGTGIVWGGKDWG